MKTNAIDWLEGRILGPLQRCEISSHYVLYFTECPNCRKELDQWHANNQKIVAAAKAHRAANQEFYAWRRSVTLEMERDSAGHRERPFF